MDSTQTHTLLERIANGDGDAVGTLLQRHHDFLHRLLTVRMEPALRQRVDPSDVIQETLIVANRRMDDFIKRRPTDFRLWIRRKALERLVEHRRKHFAKKRSAARDIPLRNASSAIARNLLADRPSKVVMQKELSEQVHELLAELSESDRELLMMRHAEGLSNGEIAKQLCLDPKTTSKRYGRALLKLSEKIARAGLSL